MTPLRPTGAWTTTTSDAGVTQTLPLTEDEWAGEHLATLRGTHLTRDEVAEGERLLFTLHELVGVQADEVMAFLTTLLHERDSASMRLVRWLRSLDAEARS